jgi:predicted N-acetyltransferase YhbS
MGTSFGSTAEPYTVDRAEREPTLACVGTFELIERDPTVQEYQRLRRAVGWGEMTDDGVAVGLPNALFSVVLERDGEAVGLGRIVGDGGLYFYLQDVIVLAEHRGLGLGARITDALMAYLERSACPGAFVGLMAAVGAEPFYERYGFHRRSEQQPGMFRIWS